MQQENKYNFTFPLLAYDGKVLHFARNITDITTCTKRGLKSGFYNNLTIIDSASRQYFIIEAVKIGYLGPFWGFHPLKGQRLIVDLNISKAISISLNQFKNTILRVVSADKFFWDSDGNLQARIEFIENSNSIEEIIAKFTYEYYDEQ